MKALRGLLFVVAIGLFVINFPIFAHHGQASYDGAKLSTVKGTVVSVDFVNPHVMVRMDVKNGDGSIERWIVEGTSPNMLVREGWDKNTVKPGDRITATGHPARDGAKAMRIEKLILSNGREVTFEGPGS